MNATALGVALGLCIAVAAFEGFLSTDGYQTWYRYLRKPRWHPPLWLFVLIALLVYLIDGVIAYRLWAAAGSPPARWIGISALVIAMLYNALWNYAFFKSKSALVGLLGIAAFVGPLVNLQVALTFFDPFSAWLNGVYAASPL